MLGLTFSSILDWSSYIVSIIPVSNRSFSRQSNSTQEHFSDPCNELGDTFAVMKRLQEILESLLPVDSPCSFLFLTAIWLTHGQLWAILKGKASLTQC